MRSQSTPKHTGSGPTDLSEGARPSVVVPAMLVLLVCLAAGVVSWMRGRSPHAAREEGAPAPELQSSSQPTSASRGASLDENVPVPMANAAVATVPPGKSQTALKRQAAVSSMPRTPASPYTRQLVNNLVNLDQTGPPKTPEQVAAWRQNLQQLVQQGSAALPAIREFLEQNVDFSFGTDAARALGYDTARAAMYDALAQIGGTDAAGLMLDTLQATASPSDIAQLARSLEQAAPGQYRQQILDAVRQALSGPTDGSAAQTDVAPLFETLAKYGGPSAVADLGDTAGRWKYYTAITLGQLPDGAGVPALVQMVQDAGGGPVKNIPALEMLTQLAAQNADARATLLEQVRANNIPPSSWAYLSAALVGDQIQFKNPASASSGPAPSASDIRNFHIAAGNQNFYTAPPPGGLSTDQMNQQIALIDELLAAAPNPTAQQTLQNARQLLLSRGSQPITVSKP